MQRKHDLEFINPGFNIGVNSTVRLGTKWAEKCLIGDQVKCIDGNGKIWGVGNVVGMCLLPFNMIPDSIIVQQHSIHTQNRYGLAKEMKLAYGDEFNEERLCTVILFEMP